MQFTKLFNSILDSTIWQETKETKLLWITMLAMSDRQGEVHSSIPGLAKRAGVTLQECEGAILCLLSPDPYSRTTEHEGRRVAIIDGGWRLLNHSKYRALLSVEERREYNRKKQAEWRGNNTPAKNVNDMSMTVNDNKQCQHSTEAEAEAEANTEEKIAAIAASPSPKPRAKAAQLPDAEFLAEISEIYPAINIPAEMRKIDAWLLVNRGRQKTRKFVINWLNRIDSPMAPTASSTQVVDNIARHRPDDYHEPNGFEMLAELRASREREAAILAGEIES